MENNRLILRTSLKTRRQPEHLPCQATCICHSWYPNSIEPPTCSSCQRGHIQSWFRLLISSRPLISWWFKIIAGANNDRYYGSKHRNDPALFLTTANSPFASFISAIFKLEYPAWIFFVYFALNHLILISNLPSCGLGEYWCTGACFEFFGLGRYGNGLAVVWIGLGSMYR